MIGQRHEVTWLLTVMLMMDKELALEWHNGNVTRCHDVTGVREEPYS